MTDLQPCAQNTVKHVKHGFHGSMDEKLILSVEEHPELWDVRGGGRLFKGVSVKQGEWRRIARELKITGEFMCLKQFIYNDSGSMVLRPIGPTIHWPYGSLVLRSINSTVHIIGPTIRPTG